MSHMRHHPSRPPFIKKAAGARQPLLMARRSEMSLSRRRVAGCQSPRWRWNTAACASEPPYCAPVQPRVGGAPRRQGRC